MTDIAIRVENLSKLYHIGKAKRHHDTLRDAVVDTLKSLKLRRNGDSSDDTIWALRDVSFEVERGEVLGIIGRNGAGKSTLLKILSRITEPTTGRVTLDGRVASLLEVGTGFHPELTGRENIYLNGAILGMRKAEIERRFDEIVAFAEIERFLDTPVKHYSSGMYVRLAFAVAAHLEPEILLVDEVLAVGDATFQKKCLGKMGDVAKEGRTVLFVSHNMAAVRQLCGTGLLLEEGRSITFDSVGECVDAYLGLGMERAGSILAHGERYSDSFRVDEITVNGSKEDRAYIAGCDATLEIEVTGYVLSPTRATIEARFFDASGHVIGEFTPAHFLPETPTLQIGPARLRAIVELPQFTKGEYLVSIFLTDPGVRGLWDFPYAVRLIAESLSLTTRGTVLENRSGRGAIIIGGKVLYDSSAILPVLQGQSALVDQC